MQKEEKKPRCTSHVCAQPPTQHHYQTKAVMWSGVPDVVNHALNITVISWGFAPWELEICLFPMLSASYRQSYAQPVIWSAAIQRHMSTGHSRHQYITTLLIITVQSCDNGLHMWGLFMPPANILAQLYRSVWSQVQSNDSTADEMTKRRHSHCCGSHWQYVITPRRHSTDNWQTEETNPLHRAAQNADHRVQCARLIWR